MKPLSELDTLRQQAILSSLAGFPFLICFSMVWLAAGALSYAVPRDMAPWLYIVLAIPAMPVALVLDRRLGYMPPPQPDPLVPLVVQLLFVQVVAFPAIMLVWDMAPHFLPVAFAAIVGAHFLPFQWVYRTRLYGILGVVVAVGPYLLAAVVGADALHYTGFLVGTALLVGALAARQHARTTWRAVQQSSRSA